MAGELDISKPRASKTAFAGYALALDWV